MSSVQTPPGSPATSGRPPQRPAEGDLYDPRRWESAYVHDHSTPILLVQLQDDLSRARMREAFWISVIVHMLIVIAIYNSPKFARLFPRSAVALSPNIGMKDKDLTFLTLPPDAQKVTKRPDTNKISDKDRIATSRKPHLDPKELRKILDSSQPGPPGPPTVPGIKPEPSPPQQTAQNAPQQPQGQPNNPPRPPQTTQTAKLTPPPQPKINFGATMSAGSAVEQAARAAAANRGGYGGAAGDYGLGQGRQATDVVGNLDVLSDTQGVDFGSYLARVVHDVEQNWYNLIPDVARPPILKRGKLSIEFAITKDGTVAGMRLASSSNDVSLDRAAWGGITASNPFQPLPNEFHGQYLALRFHFYYNPDSNDLQ